jgi:hypothetical protein
MHEGSDCITGKTQFATKKAARAAACSGRNMLKRTTLQAFRCQWCECYHIGNSRSSSSKGRARR